MKKLTVTIQGSQYILNMAGYDPDLVDFCKELQQARYNPHTQEWRAVRNVPNALDLQAGEFLEDFETLLKLRPRPLVAGNHDWEFVERDRYGHQLDWQEWSKTVPRSLCAAEPGLGKTYMSMIWWRNHRIAPSEILVICPSSLLDTWAKEIKLVTGLKALVVRGSAAQKKKLAAVPGFIHIINYEAFARPGVGELFGHKTCLILDESHGIKNPSAMRSKSIHAFGLDARRTHVLLLTGTPIGQGPQDYFSQMKVIEPALLGSSFTAFKARYCELEQIRGAPVGIKRIVRYKRMDELTRLIAPYSRTYTQKECLDLPPQTFTTRYVELSDEQRATYKELKEQMAIEFEDNTQMMTTNVLARLTRLMQIVQGFKVVTDMATRDQKKVVFEKNPKLDALE